MGGQKTSDSLPLLSRTPSQWAKAVLKDPLALLSDHAYLERKATSNALALLNRWPEPKYPSHWVPALSSIARDEALHLERVQKILHKKGGRLQRSHRSPYANDLRNLVRKGWGKEELVDRLLTSALIEARSCERFEVLAKACVDKDLAGLYKGLWSSEFGHYKVFLKLAWEVMEKEKVQKRWEELLKDEEKIIHSQAPGPWIHSGLN